MHDTLFVSILLELSHILTSKTPPLVPQFAGEQWKPEASLPRQVERGWGTRGREVRQRIPVGSDEPLSFTLPPSSSASLKVQTPGSNSYPMIYSSSMFLFRLPFLFAILQSGFFPPLSAFSPGPAIRLHKPPKRHLSCRPPWHRCLTLLTSFPFFFFF